MLGDPGETASRKALGARVDCNGIDEVPALPQLANGIQHLDLAGNSLAEYPYFEHVCAFNRNATVELAVDTARFPRLIGVTADLYVIAACSGPRLHPQVPVVTFTFVAGSIQQNTVLIAGPGSL